MVSPILVVRFDFQGFGPRYGDAMTAEIRGRRVVVVDDDDLLRGLLANQLTMWGFDVREASNSQQAVSICREFDPDGVMLDVDLGAGLNGFQLAEALIRRLPHLGIVFLTRYPDARSSIARLSPTLRDVAYVNKGAVETSTELLNALNVALTGQGDSVRHDERHDRPLSMLTASQLGVLSLVHQGLTNAQIAAERKTSISAVEKMMSRIFVLLNINPKERNARARAVGIYAESYGGRR
jgi:DNA-binding NarL/FixJ family response regulator